MLSIAQLFLSICRYQALPLKIAETRLDKKRPQQASHVVPLTSKRTLSTSSKHKVSIKDGSSSSKGQLNEHRRSRSLSSLDSPSSEHPPPIPDIQVDGVSESAEAESEFDHFHRKYSPSEKDIVEPRISHSSSDSSLASSQRPPSAPLNTMSKMEGFFRKTKSALGTVGPKLRDLSFNKDESNGESSQSTQPQPQQEPQGDSVKTTLKRFNNKFASRAAEMKSKVLPEFKNRIQNALASSPRAQRKKLLSEDEKERRRQCKTKILEL